MLNSSPIFDVHLVRSRIVRSRIVRSRDILPVHLERMPARSLITGADGEMGGDWAEPSERNHHVSTTLGKTNRFVLLTTACSKCSDWLFVLEMLPARERGGAYREPNRATKRWILTVSINLCLFSFVVEMNLKCIFTGRKMEQCPRRSTMWPV